MSSIAGKPGCAAIAAALALLAGCASAPTQEMSDARQSVQVAEEAGAGQYDVQNLRAAREHLQRAERELELRYFSNARLDARIAKSEAIKAHDVALALKDAQHAIDNSKAGAEIIEKAKALLSAAKEAAEQGRDKRAIQLATDARRKAEGKTFE
jgi:hypothetical protein